MHMTSSKVTGIKRVIVVRLHSGEDIIETLEKVVRERDIKGGQLNLIGAIERATLGYFDIKQNKYKEFTVEKELEVVSCMGNIARLKDDTIVIHAHMITSDENGQCYGGHVMRGCRVSATIEAIIIEFETELLRERDPATGLNLLNLT